MIPHVTLRPLTLHDTEVAARWGEDPEFCAYAGWTERATVDRVRLWRDLVVNSPVDLLRLAAADDVGDLVGYVDLMGLDDDRRELGYLVGPRDRWGRGWGTAIAAAGLEHGFTVLVLSEIHAEAMAAKVPSVRILQRLGMSETGRGDEDTFLGEATFYRCFSMTRPDWLARRASPGSGRPMEV